MFTLLLVFSLFDNSSLVSREHPSLLPHARPQVIIYNSAAPRPRGRLRYLC